MNRALLFGCALVLLFVAVRLAPTSGPVTAPAYEDAAGTVAAKIDTPRSHEPSLFSPGYLLAIALLAGGGWWAIHLRKTRASGETDQPLTAMSALPLGPNASARLVRCGDEVLLLGIGGGSVTLLKTYPATAFADAPASSPALPGMAFADLLQRYAPSARPQASPVR